MTLSFQTNTFSFIILPILIDPGPIKSLVVEGLGLSTISVTCLVGYDFLMIHPVIGKAVIQARWDGEHNPQIYFSLSDPVIEYFEQC